MYYFIVRGVLQVLLSPSFIGQSGDDEYQDLLAYPTFAFPQLGTIKKQFITKKEVLTNILP